jgi:gluconate 2-dehydrogenase gamma chain
VSLLTEDQFRTLEALADTLIPADASGPGALDAQVAPFIDTSLALLPTRCSFVAGLESTDTYALSRYGARYVQLSAQYRAEVLADIERGSASGFEAGSVAFFEMFRSLALEGMFCDPTRGGNANYIGWRLIGYPGNKFVVPPRDQALDVIPKPIYIVGDDTINA